MKKKYIVGIDSGGSNSEAMLVDSHLNILAEERYKGVNIQREGKTALSIIFGGMIFDICTKGGLVPGATDFVVVGAAGAGREKTKTRFFRSFRSTHFEGKIIITTDMEILYRSIYFKDSGIVINSGTGSFGFFMDEKGKEVRAGGWGYLVGDEGSGYDIGRRGIAAALKSFDGRGEKSILEDMVCEKFQLVSIKEIIPLIYENEIGVEQIAGVAALLSKAASKNDRAAISVLNEAAYEIVLHIRTLKNKYSQKAGPIKVALSGGVFQKNPVLVKMIDERIGDEIEIFVSNNKSVKGAIVMGLEELGIAHPDDRIKEFLSK